MVAAGHGRGGYWSIPDGRGREAAAGACRGADRARVRTRRGHGGFVRESAGRVGLLIALLGCASVPAPVGAAPDSLAVVAPGSDVREPAGAAPADTARSPGPGHWFYRGLPYGSESLVNPLRMVLDCGFGILTFDTRSNRIDDVNYERGWHRVWADLADPARAIEVEGWGSWIQREVLPVSTSRQTAQYWPNYTLHLVGGGMGYTMLSEWYAQRGVAHPHGCAIGTMAVGHLLNEVVENDRSPGPNTDALTDLYLFDPFSIVLFSYEGVNGFFSRRLHMRYWPGQAALDPRLGTLEDGGQNYSIKLAIPRSDHWSLFYYFGNHGELGLSYTKANGSAFSFGAGLRAKGLVDIGGNVLTADLVPSAGFFYDRDGSLLFSVSAANTSRYRVRVNAYPGLLRVGGRTAGLFALWNRDDQVVVGLTVPWLPVGAAGRW